LGKLMVGLARILPFCAVLLVLSALAVQGADLPGGSGAVPDIRTLAAADSSFTYQLLKHTTILFADGRGDVILERTLRNGNTVNWSNTTWYFDWPSGIYAQIRAWDDSGPLIYSTQQSGTRINITVNFRQPIQPGQGYHFSLAITIANMASITGNNGRAYWSISLGSPVQELIQGIIFPSDSTILSIIPPPTSQSLHYLEWRHTNISANFQYTIDVNFILSLTPIITDPGGSNAQPVYSTEIPQGKAPNLIVIVHGCCTEKSGLNGWEGVRSSIKTRIEQNQPTQAWEIVVWDWTEVTKGKIPGIPGNPGDAYRGAPDHSESTPCVMKALPHKRL
jgi:hypothetical protein